MTINEFSYRSLIKAGILLAGFFLPQLAWATISVTEAKISAGKLIVSGTSELAGTVLLDGLYTTQVMNKTFSFSLVYVPASCIVSIGAPGATIPSIRAAVANCAPMPVQPAGVWQPDREYQPNDLVEREKKQFVALANPRPNLNEDPMFATSFWRALPPQIATAEQTILTGPQGGRGEKGPAGQEGPKGEKGEKGEDGALADFDLHTIKAELIRPASENGQMKKEWVVTSRGTLAVTITQEMRGDYVDLVLPLFLSSFADQCIVTGIVFDSPGTKQGGLGRLVKSETSLVLPVRTNGDVTHVDAIVLCPKAP